MRWSMNLSNKEFARLTFYKHLAMVRVRKIKLIKRYLNISTKEHDQNSIYLHYIFYISIYYFSFNFFH
jgi:dolichol kinase